jgi:hypothetical protein
MADRRVFAQDNSTNGRFGEGCHAEDVDRRGKGNLCEGAGEVEGREVEARTCKVCGVSSNDFFERWTGEMKKFQFG